MKHPMSIAVLIRTVDGFNAFSALRRPAPSMPECWSTPLLSEYSCQRLINALVARAPSVNQRRASRVRAGRRRRVAVSGVCRDQGL